MVSFIKQLVCYLLLIFAGTIAIVWLSNQANGNWQRINFVVEHKCIPLMHGEPAIWR